MRALFFVSVVGLLGCSSASRPAGPLTDTGPAAVAAPGHDTNEGSDSGVPTEAAPVVPSPHAGDGNDELSTEPGDVQLPARGHFTRVGRAPLALQRVCDLTSFGGRLYAAHARRPLGSDGATVSVYDADDTSKPFRVAFDWNRAGEPTKGGGAGQGFLRVHRIQQRLFVADADPPYGGFGVADWGTEGFVFVSDAQGRFAPARAPNHRPPSPPTVERAGAVVLPRAYHVLDAIAWHGDVWASTGSVPPKQPAWRGASPGALHRLTEDYTRMTYALDYPNPWLDGVWRLTFMVRFGGKLLAGIQDYDGRDPHDYVVVECAGDANPGADPEARCADADLRITPRRVTQVGTAQTLRWYADGQGSLYWITWNREGVRLRHSRDAEQWSVLPLPEGLGRPTDVRRVGDDLLVLGEWGLWKVAVNEVSTPASWRLVAAVEAEPAGKKNAGSPFALGDLFCAAPMELHQGALYVGGQRDGALYRLDSAE